MTHSAEIAAPPLVEVVADIIDRRTGRHMGIESWVPMAEEILTAVQTRPTPPGETTATDEAARPQAALKGGASE